VIADQAIAVNPNLAEALRTRGWVSSYLGQHERAIEQFHYAMRLNPLDPQVYYAEGGLALANFLHRRFEVALSWATKSLARQKNYVPGQVLAMVSYAMLGRIADAQLMLARLREAGNILPISQTRKRITHWQQEDAELFIEACRIVGIPE
jgi:tetratricopeptide (TPR) repeat protein